MWTLFCITSLLNSVFKLNIAQQAFRFREYRKIKYKFENIYLNIEKFHIILDFATN